MVRIAEIRNADNIVANVIEAAVNWPARIGFTNRVLGANENCGPGFIFNGSTFDPPPPGPSPTDVQELNAAVVALALTALDELNLLRDWITQYKAAVAAAGTLAALKTSVAAMPNLPQRTRPQLMNAVKSKIIDGSIN